MARAKNITNADIERIVAILDGWSGKLTWDLLIDSIKRHTKVVYTRQTLNNHARIKNAYSLRKDWLSKGTSLDKRKLENPELQMAIEKITRLEGENQRLRMENDRILEKMVTWAYNAHTRGLTEEFLSQPLPVVDRAALRK